MALPIVNIVAALGVFYLAFTSGGMERPPLEDEVKKAGPPIEETILPIEEIPDSDLYKPQS